LAGCTAPTAVLQQHTRYRFGAAALQQHTRYRFGAAASPQPSLYLLNLSSHQLILSQGAPVDAGADVRPINLPRGKPRPGAHLPGIERMSALMLAASWGNVGAAHALLEGGADLNRARVETPKCARAGALGTLPPHLTQTSRQVRRGGWSALMCAAARADVPTALALLLHGADATYASDDHAPKDAAGHELFPATLAGWKAALDANCRKQSTTPLPGWTALDALCLTPPRPPRPTAGPNDGAHGALKGRHQRLASLLLWVGAEAGSRAAPAVLRQWEVPAHPAAPPALTDNDVRVAIKHGPVGIRASARTLLLHMRRAGVPDKVVMRVIKECMLTVWLPRRIKPVKATSPPTRAPAAAALRRLHVPQVSPFQLYQNGPHACP
jgi:hypothetical protein